MSLVVSSNIFCFPFFNTGTMKPPKVYLQQQSSNDDLNVTLFCVVRDFYPGEIFVKWEEEKKGMSLKGYDAHGLKCDHEKQRCSLVSILEVPTSKWLTGVSYACLVAHVSSENITIRRTNSLSGKIHLIRTLPPDKFTSLRRQCNFLDILIWPACCLHIPLDGMSILLYREMLMYPAVLY